MQSLLSKYGAMPLGPTRVVLHLEPNWRRRIVLVAFQSGNARRSNDNNEETLIGSKFVVTSSIARYRQEVP
jgi:hypothetical protein